MKNAPKLRFKEFSGDWEAKELGQIAAISSGGTPSRGKPEYWGGAIPWVTTSLVDFNIIRSAEEFITEEGLKNSSAKLFPENTLLMAMYGQGKTRGKVAILGFKATTNQACAAIILDNSIADNWFVFHNLFGRYDEIRDLSNAGGQENLSGGLIKSIKISLPTLVEQTKIANFLTAIDDRITQLTQKVDGLEQYKKAVMQQIFSQKLRFKDEKGRAFGAWEEKRLGSIFSEITNKIGSDDIETYSISAGKGFVSQKEKFGKDISGMQNKNYIKLNLYDFAYNKGSSKSFLYGCVYPNTTGKIIGVPNVFICFRGDMKIATLFYAKLFEWRFLDKSLRKIISSSVRMDGLLNVNKEDFFNIELPYPCVEEQEKIAGFLGAVDEKLAQAKAKLDAVKQYKQGLLQQMFV
jgi:type I restriction enzyme S subunit